jgi:glycosyltransferase involved in cell wall biosynthesis
MIMNRADRIIANSKWTMDATLPKDYPRDRAEVIYNGVDTRNFKKVKSDIKDKLGCEFLSTTVCRLIPQKGVRYLIEAVRKIEGDFKAIIIGRGPNLELLREMVKNFGLEKKVEFETSFITDEELVRYYSASDFSILPSLWEPFGITLIEAMACGNPIVATKVGGIPEVVTGDCGFIVRPQSSEEIAAAVNCLIGDENLRKKMAKKARERVERVFDFDVISKKVELSYSNFLAGRN